MKIFTLFTFTLFISVLSSQAQISKGSVLLGGSLSFSNNDYSDGTNGNESNSFSFHPAVGVAVKENRVFGVFLSYSRNQNETIGYPPGKALSYGGGFLIRQYMGLGKGFYLFGQGDLGYMHYSQEQGSSNSEITSKSNNVSLNVYPGISYAVSKKFHFELLLNNMLGISYGKGKQTNTTGSTPVTIKSSNFGFHTNINPSTSISLGFRVLLGNQKEKS